MEEDTPLPLPPSSLMMTLASGTRIDLNDIKPEQISPYDIAHSLSMLCRFGGHTNVFYSVAQHSVRVARALPPELMLQGLLHDATETFVGDMIRPLKQMLPEYQAIEDRVWFSIARRFQLPPKMHPLVKIADNACLKAEIRQFMHYSEELSRPYWFDVVELPEAPVVWKQKEAFEHFLKAFSEAAFKQRISGL